MQQIEQSLLRRIRGSGNGWCFTPADFADLGGASAVWTALHRLTKRGAIRRLARGLYDVPETHPVLGTLSPDAEAMAQAIARNRHIHIQATGAYAANLLGLSEQVPARIAYLTDGAPRRIRIGNREIVFRRTTPRNMATAGRISGLVIQALRYIGKERLTPSHRRILARRLSPDDKRQLLKDRLCAPGWMRPIFAELTGKDEGHA
jgi:hypothetical protein